MKELLEKVEAEMLFWGQDVARPRVVGNKYLIPGTNRSKIFENKKYRVRKVNVLQVLYEMPQYGLDTTYVEALLLLKDEKPDPELTGLGDLPEVLCQMILDGGAVERRGSYFVVADDVRQRLEGPPSLRAVGFALREWAEDGINRLMAGRVRRYRELKMGNLVWWAEQCGK